MAFSILALILGVLFEIFSVGLRRTQMAADFSRAVLLGESRLATVGVEEPLAEGTSSGAFDDNYRWQAIVAPYPVATDTLGAPVPSVLPYTVTVEVTWGDPAHERSVALTTVRLGEAK